MSFYVVDVESDGPCPGLYSMVCFGAVKVTPELNETFYGQTCPISSDYVPDALAVSGFSREEHSNFHTPEMTMRMFQKWVEKTTDGRPTFISDNNGFDWQWINYYFHRYVGDNPFGFSSRRIGDLYCGMVKDAGKNRDWKRLRKTTHTHNPVDDAKGNAEALLEMKRMGLRIGFK